MKKRYLLALLIGLLCLLYAGSAGAVILDPNYPGHVHVKPPEGEVSEHRVLLWMQYDQHYWMCSGKVCGFKRLSEPVDCTPNRPNPTCTEPVVCTVCEYTLRYAWGHWLIDITPVAPTCTQDGSEGGKKCVRCEYVEKPTVVPAAGHKPTDVSEIAPTCTEPGQTAAVRCSACLVWLTPPQEIESLGGHDFQNYVSNNNATCTQDSTETGKCSRCEEMDTRAVADTALGHAPVVDSAVNPTCTQPGLTEGSHCERCPEILTEQQVVPVLGHAPVADPAVAPTCIRTGLTLGSHCGRCTATLTAQRVVAALGHDAVVDPAVEPLCEQPGLTEGTHCGRCDAILLAQERVSCRGHWYAEWTPNGDGTHGAGCLREGCRFAGTAACTQLEAGDITFCPICGGASDGTRLARVEGAKVAADRIPPGELMVRQRDGLLAICFVRSGKLSRPYVPATVILPNGDSHVIAFAQSEAPVLVVR